ncbi:MMPL family transporter [Nocardioides sp.]|uniref:MMPL family transporter n=1 Tax=Nocardioides sp. TaxID=35761 RepID=UPI001A32D73C|nr:MMPL family transporter [Nocardioides sp.]MBJ7355923.1 MMPL family transporter [Nocardioides sp.]
MSVATWSARRPWVTLTAWLLLAVVAWTAARAFSAGYDDEVELPNTQSVQGLDELAADGEPPAASGTVVLRSAGTALSGHADEIDAALERTRDLDHVGAVADPLTTPGSLSSDGRIGLVDIDLTQSFRDLDAQDLEAIDAAFDPLRAEGVDVEYAGQLGSRMDRSGSHRVAEVVGLVCALVVLLVIFGSVLAALVPLATAIMAVVVGLLALTATTGLVSFASVSPTLATMIGLGTGIDYALFVVTRHRQLLIDGADPVDAAAATARTTGHAVLVGAGTVALALLGLYASGISFIGNLGLAAVLSVVTSALAAMTLVPAVLGLLGRHVDRWRLRRPVAEPTTSGSGWSAHALRVARRPWPFLLGGFALLAVLSAPLLALDTGSVDDSAASPDTTSRRAFDLVTEGFGIGRNGTLTVVLSAGALDPADAARETAAARDAIAATPDVTSVGPFAQVEGTELWAATVQPGVAPGTKAAEDLFLTLRDEVVPDVTTDSGLDPGGWVTGSLAVQLEFGRAVVDRLPLIIGVIVVAAFLLLVVTFRSVVLALKAALLNVLSIGASYGVLVAVFQWQLGSGLLGVDGPVPIESYVPMIMFVVVFGLSMDYEVFLLSRVRESWLASGDTTRAVAEGLSATARVITAAALIMVSVFLGFTLDDDITVKMLAVGLAVSVAVDATVVRLVLVPAAMAAMGGANWWIPRWLDRVLPGSSTPRASA